MAVRRTSARLSGGSVESPTPHSHQNPLSSGDVLKKRKATLNSDDDKTNKRRKDAPIRPPKQSILRPGNRFEVPGGLIITPAPMNGNAQSTQNAATSSMKPPPARPAPETKRPANERVASTSQSIGLGRPPPQTAQPNSKGKDRALALDPPEIVEEVRSMRAELDDLTRIEEEDARKLTTSTSTRHRPPRASQSQSALHISINFPKRQSLAPPRLLPRATPLSSSDSTVPLPIHDTPMIQKNIDMRKQANERRRSSLGGRGSRGRGGRASSLGGLAVALPHPSVPTSKFHKHIAGDLPEPVRARHLLVWCAARSQTAPASKASAPSALSEPMQALLKQFQTDFIKSLSSGDVDIPLYGENDVSDGGVKFKEHEQNVRNHKREREWSDWIETCKTEDAAWSQLIQSYNNRQAEVVTLLAAKAHAASASAPGSSTPSRSGKARPSRAAMEEDWIRELEQDPHWHTAVSLTRDEGKVRAGGLENDLAAESDTESDDGKQLAARLEGLELQVDALHSLTHTASEMADRSNAHLSHFLGELSDRLRTRTISSQPSSSTAPSITSIMPPPSSSSSSQTHAQTRDPRDLLRALSHSGVPGPAQRRGNTVRRTAQDTQIIPERKVTATPKRLPPGTPARKPPGTPRNSRNKG